MTTKIRLHLTRRERAQSMAEFAIVLSVLVMMILIIVDLGRITYSYSALHNAAREGTRFGAVDFHWKDTAAIEAHARSYAIGLNLDPGILSITATTTETPTVKEVNVIAEYQFRTATGILHLLTGQDAFTLRSSSTMNLEYLVGGS